MFIHIRLLVLLTTVCLLHGCGSTQTEIKLPSETEKLPSVSQNEKLISEAKSINTTVSTLTENNLIRLPKSVAILPFVNDTNEPDASDILRNALYGHIASSNYNFPHLKNIENRLAILDPEKPLSPADAKLLTQLLDVDGLLFGKVIQYDTFFIGLYAQITFEVEITFVDKQGNVIWQERVEEISREGGISASPWSLLYSLAVTAMHLEDDNLLAVADKLGRKIAAQMPQPDSYKGQIVSYIQTVLHDATDKFLKYGDTLRVGIKGDKNKLAKVKIEGIDEMFPLKETEPGEYLADIVINRKWNGHDLMLTGFLSGTNGAVSKSISPLGLLNIDNLAPKVVEIISTKVDQNTLSLRWKKAEQNLIYSIYQVISGERILLAQTADEHVTIPHGATMFSSVNYHIEAQDQANNKSELHYTKHWIYPFPNLYEAKVFSEVKLPTFLKGDILLKKQHGPFLVETRVVLTPGSNLFIEPGTQIHFSNLGNLKIKGSLYTFKGQPIQLSPLTEVSTAQTFLTLDSHEHLEIQNMEIKQAGIAIEVLAGRATVTNSAITDSKYSAIVVSNSAVLNIDNCLLRGSNTSGMVVTDQARLKVTNTKFENNFPFHLQSSSIYELEATENIWIPAPSPMTILGNIRY
ncbi:MAG: hypothetical protein ACJAV1_002689 [Paraglaciecola sp.]|jgi:hypothetical protein